MDIKTLMGRPDFAQAYAEWLKHPITVAVREAVDGMLRPYGIPAPTGESALYQLGLFVGQSGMRGIIFDMDEALRVQEQVAAQSRLVARYGEPRMASSGPGVK